MLHFVAAVFTRLSKFGRLLRLKMKTYAAKLTHNANKHIGTGRDKSFEIIWVKQTSSFCPCL